MTVLRYREDPAVVRPEVERLAEIQAGFPDVQGHYYALAFRAVAAGLDGDHEAAFALSEQARDANPMAGGEWLYPAGEAAMWLRDRERLSALLADLAERRPLGRMNEVWRIEIEAARDALDGRMAEAFEGFDRARRGWQDLGLTLHTAQNRMHCALLCGGTPEGRAAAEEARALLDQMGAPTLLALLDEATGAALAR